MKIACIAAHQDDFVNVAGTLCRLADAGCDISYLVTTDSRYDHAVKPTPPMELVEMLDREAKEFCRICGVGEFVNWRYEDGFVEPTAELRRRILAFLRERQPEALFLMWPNDTHVDHRFQATKAEGKQRGRARLPIIRRL